MAKAKMNLRAKKSKVPQPRMQKWADVKYMGPEPDADVVIESRNDTRFSQALNWYNYYYTESDARGWLLQYMETDATLAPYIKTIKSTPDWRTPTTAGFISKLILRGWELPLESIEWVNKRIMEVVNSTVRPDSKEPKVTPRVIDRVNDRARYLAYGILDEHIDQFIENNSYTFSLYDILTKESASPIACEMIRKRIAAILSDIDFDKPAVKVAKIKNAFYNKIIDDLDRFQQNKKAVRVQRKPRTVKEQPAEKLVSKMKYMKEHAALKLVSVSPHTIIKAQSLWIYNDKYKQLTVFNASSDAGLSVKGATIMGFDETTSMVKRLRKPAETIQKVLSSGKIGLRKIMSELTTVGAVPKGRIGPETILLRVVTK
jgi:hypothetical protein